MLVCEMEPGGTAAVRGPADVVLTVEEPIRPSAFRVYGSATLGGFVFVVWFHTGSAPGRLGVGGLAHSPISLTPSLLRSPMSVPCTPRLVPGGVAPTSHSMADTSQQGAAGE